MPDTCIHGRRVSQSCPGCGNAPAGERERDLVSSAKTFRVVIPGNPGAAKVNTRTTSIVVPSKTARSGRARVVLSKGYRDWRTLATGLMRRALPSMVAPPWREGPLAVTVSAYWPTCNRTGAAADIARGDVDAVAKACLDALEHAGVLTDDAQVVSLTCAKAYDRRDPRIEIEVRRAQ
jgi:Holliday junction resolvase RusA-like endonuclease